MHRESNMQKKSTYYETLHSRPQSWKLGSLSQWEVSGHPVCGWTFPLQLPQTAHKPERRVASEPPTKAQACTVKTKTHLSRLFQLVVSLLTFSPVSQVLTRLNMEFWRCKSSWLSRDLMARAAIFLQVAESSFNMANDKGTKNKPQCSCSRACEQKTQLYYN